MVTTIWTANNCRLGDHATPGSGTWEIYFNPQMITETWEWKELIADNMIGGIIMSEQQGIFGMRYILQGCVRAPDTAAAGSWAKFKRALRDWGENDTILYFSNKIATNSFDMATWADSDYADVSQTIVIVKAVKIVEQTNDAWTFNVTLKMVDINE